MNIPNRPKRRDVRVNRPERTQVEMRFLALDQMLDDDHRARIVWQFVESLDLELLYARFKVVPGESGRNAIAPEILLGLWLMATIDSISSARELARRTTTDIPYMWLCGGVSVNHHTLSDFRSLNGEFFEKMLVDTVTAMMQEGFVTFETLGHDGMRVRANAGSSSFRRKPTLQELHQQAKEHVESLREESEDTSKQLEHDARRKAARQRAAQQRADRIGEALRQVEALHEQKEKRKNGDGEKARCSTTDPDARKMKMADGGFRPAYNFQLTTEGKSRMVVAVDVTNSGSDRGELAPRYQQVQETYSVTPGKLLVDSAFAIKEDVTEVERSGTEVVSTIYQEEAMRKHGRDPYERKPGDSDEFANFRQRMSRADYQAIYKQRPSIAEFPNAEFRNRGCHQLPVRGLERVKSVALLLANAFNLMRMWDLRSRATV
jgi:transposase